MAMAILAKIALGAASAGGGGGSGSNSAKGGTGSGTIAKGIVLSQAILKTLKASWSVMKEMSGQLKASFNLLKKSFALMIKPIADTIGLLLRPLAISLMRFAVPFYKKWLKSETFEALMTPADERTEKQGFQALTAKAGASAAAGAGIGLGMGGPAGAVLGAMIGPIIAMLGDAWRGIQNIALIISEWGDLFQQKIRDFNQKIAGYVTQVNEAVAAFFTEKIPEWWQAGIDAIIEKWNLLKTFFGETIPNWVKQGWESAKTFFTETIPTWFSEGWVVVKTFVTETVPGWFTDGWNVIKTFVTETIPSWFTDGWETVKTLVTETFPGWIDTGWDSVKNFFTTTIPDTFTNMVDKIRSSISRLNPFGRKEGRARGGMINQTGMYNLHSGEMVMRAGQVQDMKQGSSTTNFNPTINVNATINNDMDVRSLAEKLSEFMEVEYRRKVSY